MESLVGADRVHTEPEIKLIGLLLQRFEVGEQVRDVLGLKGVEETFRHHAEFGEPGAFYRALRNAQIFQPLAAKDDGFRILRDQDP